MAFQWQPETVDLSDPATPPVFDAAKVQAGIELALKPMTDRGWRADPCMAPPDAAAAPMVEKQLASVT